MKKLLFLLFFFFIINVNADTCTVEEKNRLKEIISKVRMEYEIFDLEEYDGYGKIYDAYFYNMTEELYISNSDDYILEYYNEEGPIKIESIETGRIQKLEFYGSDKSKCKNQLIDTKLYSFPYYNDYSENYLCEGIEDFDLCKKEKDTSSLSFYEFEKAVLEYKESLKEEKEDEQEENKVNIFNKLFDFLIKYYVFILYPIIVISIIGVVLIKLKERKEIL